MASKARPAGGDSDERDGNPSRFAGVIAVLYFLVTIGSTALIASTGTTEQQMERAAVGSFLPTVTANLDVAVASMLGYVVSMVLLIAFGIALSRIIGDGSLLTIFAPAAIALGGTLFIAESLLTVGIFLELAPAYTTATGSEQALLGSTAAALLLFRSYTALTAGGVVSLAAVLYGRSVLRTDVFPRWLGWLAVGFGGVGLVGMAWPLLPAISYVRQIAYIMFAIWVLVAGLLLLSK